MFILTDILPLIYISLLSASNTDECISICNNDNMAT